MRFPKKAFTLIELLVVITILALLTSIAFSVYTSYLRNTRDGIRLSHLETIGKTLNVYVIEESLYPKPSDFTSVTYSGETIWNQGEFTEETKEMIATSGKLSDNLKDPNSNTFYSYSTTESRKEYQIAAISEGSITNYPLTNKANADGATVGYAVVKGNFNRKIIGIFNDSTNLVLAVPSIIVNNLDSTDLISIVTNKRFVYDKYTNLPANFSGLNYNLNGGFDFSPNTLVLYNGSMRKLQADETTRVTLLENLQDAYVGTILENSLDNIAGLDIDTSNPSEEAKELAIFIVEKFLNKPVSEPKVFVQKTLKNTSWTDISSNPLDLYETGSIFVENWDTNACDIDAMSIVELDPGTNVIPSALAASTIYRLSDGIYINSNSIVMDDCSAIIGYGSATLYSEGDLSQGSIYLSNKSNVIIHGIEINGTDDGNGGTHDPNDYGINVEGSEYLTLNHLSIYKTEDGIELDNTNDATINYVRSYFNEDDGINFQLTSERNTLSNIIVYNNGDDGLGFYGTPNYNTINNVQSFNNFDEGIMVGAGTDNLLNNIFSYKNLQDGLNLGGSNNTIVNNYYGFENGLDGINLNSRSNTLYGTIQLFGNGGSAITSGDTYGSDDYLGFDDGFKLTTGSFGTTWITIPSVTGWDYNATGYQAGLDSLIDGSTTHTYGTSVINQTRLIKYNSGNHELYGNNWYHYVEDKKIGEF